MLFNTYFNIKKDNTERRRSIRGDPGPVSRLERKGARAKAEEPLDTNFHQTISKNSSEYWLLIGDKNVCYFCAQTANSISEGQFVCSYTTAIFSPYLSGSFTKVVRAREIFISTYIP